MVGAVFGPYDRDRRVQTEPVTPGQTRDALGSRVRIGLDFHAIPEAQNALARPRAGGDPAPHRRAVKLRQQWVVLDQRVRFVGQAPALDRASDPADHRGQDRVQFLVVRRRRRLEAELRVFPGGPVGSVQNQRVEVHVEIQRAAEALDERHGAAMFTALGRST